MFEGVVLRRRKRKKENYTWNQWASAQRENQVRAHRHNRKKAKMREKTCRETQTYLTWRGGVAFLWISEGRDWVIGRTRTRFDKQRS